ncbi:MAG: hypothetical protein K6G69_07485 [Lachnospiraceae bacterium]|nr:hypothetical protein [Lachnospiraceae bacterium]
MSYAMTHLIIADRFADNDRIKYKDLFLLASIAPDAVHARKDFSKELKARSHYLQEDAVWGEIYEESKMVKWYYRLKEFYTKRIQMAVNDPEVVFLQGYTLHILTDMFNCKLLYAPNWIKYGLDAVDAFRVEYRNECILQDNFLYQNYHRSSALEDELENAFVKYDIAEMITHLELSDLIDADNIIDNVRSNFKTLKEAPKASFEGLKMVSEKDSGSFIDEVESECERLLFTFPDAERTFNIDTSLLGRP